MWTRIRNKGTGVDKLERNTEKFEKALSQLDIQLSDEQIHQFMVYYEMLVETNKVMNLTAITKIDDVMVKHFLDSLLITSVTNLNSYESLIDIGTGAGFPGIPLKIMFPHLKVTLLDSLKKRLNFLDDVICKLKIDNIETIHGRAEDFGKDANFREKYDLCVSRAVANLSSLSEFCIPFVKSEGKFISYKSEISDLEVKKAEKAITILGGRQIDKVEKKLPCSEITRSFITINKEGETPNKYPRKPGIPMKNPIK